MFENGGHGETGLEMASFFAQTGRAGTRALSVATLQRPVTRTGETIRPLASPAHEFFISQSDSSSREITINKAILGTAIEPHFLPNNTIFYSALNAYNLFFTDFGFTPYMTSSPPKAVIIHNRTNAKVAVDWIVPFAHGITEKQIEALTAESDREKDIITEG